MNQVNPLNVVQEIKDRFENWKTQMNYQRKSAVSDDELQIAAQCFNLIMANYEHELDDEALVYYNDDEPHESDPSDDEGPRTRSMSQASQSTKDMDSDNDDDYEQSPKKVNRDEASITDEDKKKVIEHSRLKNGNPRSISSIQNRFGKWVKSHRQIQQWEQQIEAGGNQSLKFKTINQKTDEKFKEMYISGLPIHDIDIRIWATEIAASLDFSFKASSSWVDRFKRRNRIKSRKVTAHVYVLNFANEASLISTATAFRSKIHEIMNSQSVVPENIWNADQSGVNYELTGNRTLAPIGEKEVRRTVQRVNATTHSFTVMPLINMAGQLHKIMFVTLQETSGQFGPLVQQKMLKPPNLYVTATRSGKMDKAKLESFIVNCLNSALTSAATSLLLVDSWGPFCNHATFKTNLPTNKILLVENIPAHCTSMCQPLDCYGFGPFKKYLRRLTDMLRLHLPQVTIAERDNELRMMSILHNQLSAERFKGLWQYAFWKAGLSITAHESFNTTPVAYAFNIEFNNCAECHGVARIRCAICENYYCLKHFMLESSVHPLKYHYHMLE